jgi:aryl-alcohol dehydrogenase-like predicted oxidoreductase
MCEQPPYSVLVRAIETEVLPVCERYGMGVIPWSPLAGGFLSGRYRKGGERMQSRRQSILPANFDMDLPENQRKMDAVEQLAVLAEEAGMTLIELSLAFVVNHPAVTSAIIGPRTMEHLESQLTSVDVKLTDDVLDRIDEIVPPGTTINPADDGWPQNPWLAPAARRRG